jgi:hypothetical protein
MTQLPPHARRNLEKPDISGTSTECRCLCGSLVARVVADGVELKCKRCKRMIIVPFPAGPGWVDAQPAKPRTQPIGTARR